MTVADPAKAAGPAGKIRYRRGIESRERILSVALQAFGSKGFQAVSTREIALAAQVNLPAIQYYFGNKDGLYQACANHIVARYVAATLAVSVAAHDAVTSRQPPLTCQQHLRAVMMTLGQFLMSSKESPGWSLFIQRELADPGSAFDIMFEQLWRPGVELVALLIGAVRGNASNDVADGAARIEAIHMISGLTAFASGRAAIDRFLTGPAPAGPQSADYVAEQLYRLIERQVALVAVET